MRDSKIRISQNRDAHFIQNKITLLISLCTDFILVLYAVQFDDDLGRRIIKVDHIISYDLLALHGLWQLGQKIVPKVLFFLGHVFAQNLGNWC